VPYILVEIHTAIETKTLFMGSFDGNILSINVCVTISKIDRFDLDVLQNVMSIIYIYI